MSSEEKTNTTSFLNPYDVVREFGIEPGMTVADFGSGAGHFAMAMAHQVERDGKVYAIDVREEPLQVLAGHIKIDGLRQVETLRANLEKPEGSKLSENSVDLVLLSNILHQLDEPKATLEEAHRVIKDTGKLVIIDWKEDTPLGPKHRFSQNRAEELAESAGFTKDRDIDTGMTHYGAIFTK